MSEDYNKLVELAKHAPEELKELSQDMAQNEHLMSMEDKLDKQAEFSKVIEKMPAELRDKMNDLVVELGMEEARRAVKLLETIAVKLVKEGTQCISPMMIAVGKQPSPDGIVRDVARLFLLDGDSFNGSGSMKRKNFTKVATILWRDKWMPFAIAFTTEAWTVKRDDEKELGDLKVSDMPDKREVIIVNGLTPTQPDKQIMSIADVHRDAKDYIKPDLVFESHDIKNGSSLAAELLITLGELVRKEKTVEQLEAEVEGVTVQEM